MEPPQAARAAPAAEPVVLLRNGNVLRGSARREGDSILVQRASVATIRLPVAEVLCWGNSLDDLYRYRVDHRKPHSLSARFADVQWCIEQGLLSTSEAELAKLQRLAPSDSRIQPMQALLASARKREQLAAEQPAPPSSPDTVAQSEFQPVDLDVSSELLATYSTRIQPLLRNRCGQSGCHGGNSPALWQIEHLGGVTRLSAKATQKNLADLLKWINENEPAASPLLVRASQAHGNADTGPLRANEHTLRRQLEAWVNGIAGREQQTEAMASDDGQVPLVARVGAIDEELSAEVDATGKPVRLPRVDDPFDPADFNRMYHRQ